MSKENLRQAQQGVANVLSLAFLVQDDENGNLVITKENRKAFGETLK